MIIRLIEGAQIYEEYSTKKIAKVGRRPVRDGEANFFESNIRNKLRTGKN